MEYRNLEGRKLEELIFKSKHEFKQKKKELKVLNLSINEIAK